MRRITARSASTNAAAATIACGTLIVSPVSCAPSTPPIATDAHASAPASVPADTRPARRNARRIPI